ncbi:TPA: polyprenyl synthetase family protein, partial [Streptococcus agalactiae]
QAGLLIGHAFQVRDDILDVTASFEELGKTPNKDIVAEKTTYPNLLGLDKSQEILDDTLKKAQAIFQNLEKKANFNARKIIDIIEGLRLNG